MHTCMLHHAYIKGGFNRRLGLATVPLADWPCWPPLNPISNRGNWPACADMQPASDTLRRGTTLRPPPPHPHLLTHAQSAMVSPSTMTDYIVLATRENPKPVALPRSCSGLGEKGPCLECQGAVVCAVVDLASKL
jgi:hypothetical protein